MIAREPLDALRRDVIFALRQLRRARGFAAAVILCLGFGIGASATVFSWMEGLVLRPLPAVRDVERLVTIRSDDGRGAWRSGTTRTASVFISLPEFRDWRAQAHTVSGLAAVSLYLFGVQGEGTGDGRAEPLYGMFVSSNYFDVLGAPPELGRAFVAADDERATTPVVVISHQLWQTRLGGVSDIVGRRIRLNGVPATIVGVAPRSFGGTLAAVNFDLWVPIMARPAIVSTDAFPVDSRDIRWLDVIGRLAPGADMKRASAEFLAIGARLAAAYPEHRDHSIHVEPLDTGPAEQLRPLFWALIGLTVLVVLIVCSNVANLLLVRAEARAREMGVRLSLGATRARLVRQLMTENVILALAGATVGIAVTLYGRGLLVKLMPTTSVPLVVHARIDVAVLGFVMAVTCLAVLVFGLAPALTASGVDLTDVLKNGGRGSRSARSGLRTSLIVAQFALSLTSLVCGAVFVRRGEYVQRMERGFTDPEHVLLVQTDMSFAGYRDLAKWQRTIDAVVDRLQRLPGARMATAATFVPLGFIWGASTDVAVEGYVPKPTESMHVLGNGVGPDYFELMGTKILDGRGITADDTPEHEGVAVVNQTFVRRYLGTSPPLGRHVRVNGRQLTVVGVAQDGKYDYKRIDDPPSPLVYYAMRQSPSNWVTFHVRTSTDPVTMIAAARRTIAEVDPALPIIAPTSLADYTAAPMFPSRLGVSVLGVLSAAALILAAMGLYAIIAYGVALRVREIGIRLALGGTSWQVIKLFVRESIELLALGIVAGVLVSLATTLVLHRQLAFLPLPDVMAVATPVAILSTVALVAGFLPARRSAKVDVASSLRLE